MEDSRQSYVFYIPWLDTIKKSVPPEHQFECIEAITRYAQTGREPEGLSAYASVVLGMAIPQIDANTKRYMNGCKGGRPRKNPPKEEIEEEKKGGFETENHSFEIENHTFEGEKPYFEGSKPNVNDNENVNVNENENVVRETRVRAKTTRFIPPTVEEVAEYCRERGNKVDPQRFVDYYTSNGWQVGKNKMKDWKAAIRSTWERDERTQTAQVNAPRAKPKQRPSEECERSGDAYDDLDAMFTNELIAKQRGLGNG